MMHLFCPDHGSSAAHQQRIALLPFVHGNLQDNTGRKSLSQHYSNIPIGQYCAGLTPRPRKRRSHQQKPYHHRPPLPLLSYTTNLQNTQRTQRLGMSGQLPDDIDPFGPDSPCTLDLCPIEWSIFQYRPDLAANIFFLAAFGVIGVVQAYLGWRWRAWGFMAGMVLGCICEMIGYVGRILMWDNPFSFNAFMIQIGKFQRQFRQSSA
jgi:hypothetical protein